MNKDVFYGSKVWRRLSKGFLLSKHYICERCGNPAEIAHHKTHLTAANMLDPAVSLNPEMLESLCMACHNTEHFGVGGAVVEGLRFDDSGDIVKGGEKDELHQRIQQAVTERENPSL